VTNRYARLIDDSFAFRLDPCGAFALWRLNMDWPEPVRAILTEYVIGIISQASRKIFGAGMPSKEVWMRSPMPRDTRAYDTLLSSPCDFRRRTTASCSGPRSRDAPREADPALASLIGRQAESMLSNMRRETTCDEVRRAVTEELRSGAPAMHRIARRLATTPSTLRGGFWKKV